MLEWYEQLLEKAEKYAEPNIDLDAIYFASRTEPNLNLEYWSRCLELKLLLLSFLLNNKLEWK